MKTQNELEGIRKSIESLEQELERTIRAPRPLTEVSQRLAVALDRIASHFRPSLHSLFTPAPDDGSEASLPVLDLADRSGASYQQEFAPLVVVTHRRELEKIILDQARAQLGVTPAGLEENPRKAAISELREKLFVAALREEALIRAAARGGFTIARRGKADPRAVLAWDRDLPKVSA